MGRLSHSFHSDFDRKLIGENSLRWILSNGSNIIAAPAVHQFSNILAELTWRTIIQMVRSFIIEKQVVQEFWYFAVRHATMMLYKVPVRLGLTLTTLFELIHHSKPNSKTLFELFSIRYFNHDTDNAKIRYKMQAHTLYGIAVGRYDRSISIIFYNPITSIYYHPPALGINESRLPMTNFPNSLRFDCGITCGLLRNKTNPIHDPFPPSTCVSIQNNNTPACGTIKNIPIPVSPILITAASSSTEHL